MNLMKWFRKNNKKLMAVLVVIIMLGFVAGPTLRYFGRIGTQQDTTVAYFGDNKKITNYDIYVSARRELEILELLGSHEMLRNIGLPLIRTQDLRALFLGELLFSERRTSPALVLRIKQMMRASNYRISDKQINDIYRRSMPSEMYWLLLKNEAQLAGIKISNDDARRLLANIIPRIFNGATYSQLIGPIVTRRGIPEKELLTTLGKLLAVFEYAKMVCSAEDVTEEQIKHYVSWENETIDAEFVRFDSAVFAETQPEPNEEKIAEHFDKYKGFLAGAISDENPYGFGYKLPDRVQLEYIAAKLDDISTTITPPTQEEIEEHYQKNRYLYTEQVPSDPNDPNSPLTERIKSYAEVASTISNDLRQQKINSKAEKIMQEAKTLTETYLQEIDIEPANLSAEQLKEMVGDYETAAEQMSKKYKIKVYSGQTGLLSATDMQADKYLGMLYLKGSGYKYSPTVLTQIVFAVDELKASELGPFDAPKPRMYENIGPLNDRLGRIVAVVRVTGAKKTSEPQDINQTFSKNTLELKQDQDKPTGEEPNEVSSETQDVYSVRKKAVENLKKLAAMDIAKSKAEEFTHLIAEDGWGGAIDKFNELYEQQSKQDQNDPNVFELQNLTNLQRIPTQSIDTLAVQLEGRPAARGFVGQVQGWLSVNETKSGKQFIEQLYALVPQDSNTVDAVPLIMEFKPNMSYYCLKNVSVKRLDQKQYEKIKAALVYREEYIQSQSLAAVHFNPENILKRMNFRPVKEKKQPADANSPTEPKEPS